MSGFYFELKTLLKADILFLLYCLAGILLIIGDAASGLAFSSFYNPKPFSGFQYLFGFGLPNTNGSVFLNSLLTTILLISLITIFLLLVTVRKSVIKEKINTT